jgi:hypothetical protein
MIRELTFFINFGFAAVRILLHFYVLCSKEALARLKPMSLATLCDSFRLRGRRSVNSSIHHRDEPLYSSVRLDAAE